MAKSKRPTEPLRSRTAAKQSQRAAAAVLDVSYRTWQDWEAGITRISPHLLRLYRHLAGLERIPFRAVGYDRPEEE